ncbi:hypothetical protein R1sor_010231 [Riccia sorocarpa]|uniref:Uncharacterized protein n=1 Tax=Riccia sorocarpa TaxID=122646 RepID=A0ABD3I1C9_9MARC
MFARELITVREERYLRRLARQTSDISESTIRVPSVTDRHKRYKVGSPRPPLATNTSPTSAKKQKVQASTNEWFEGLPDTTQQSWALLKAAFEQEFRVLGYKTKAQISDVIASAETYETSRETAKIKKKNNKKKSKKYSSSSSSSEDDPSDSDSEPETTKAKNRSRGKEKKKKSSRQISSSDSDSESSSDDDRRMQKKKSSSSSKPDKT